jgi:hypothetical protein
MEGGFRYLKSDLAALIDTADINNMKLPRFHPVFVIFRTVTCLKLVLH